jgi:hypothetical protein
LDDGKILDGVTNPVLHPNFEKTKENAFCKDVFFCLETTKGARNLYYTVQTASRVAFKIEFLNVIPLQRFPHPNPLP